MSVRIHKVPMSFNASVNEMWGGKECESVLGGDLKFDVGNRPAKQQILK